MTFVALLEGAMSVEPMKATAKVAEREVRSAISRRG